MSKEFHITSDQSGRRIDRLLRTMWPEVPLGYIMKALRTGEVRLDAKKTKPDTRVEEGQFLQVPWNDCNMKTSDNAQKKARARQERLDTVYRDEYLWIINKPAGLLTQPDTRNGDSLITRVLAELNWTRKDFRPSTVQRLDRNTSGALIVAMTGPSLRYLSELIRERKIKKMYRAVVSGEIADSGDIDFPLLKSQEGNIVSVDKKGQKALTLFRKISGNKSISSVEAELVTGRPHQARVHFAALGHPIVGDVKYGGETVRSKRPLLHAYSVTFPCDEGLPETVRGKEFKAPLPKDMEEYFNEM
ncbi:MAG: RluA family pseudouridine synthase [Synergistaceae bacterium]|nr:RluA family pseudouridine synthase [Synergistaceae bacterium]